MAWVIHRGKTNSAKIAPFLNDLTEHHLAARIVLPLQRYEFEELYIKGAFQQEYSDGNDQLYRQYPKVETQMCCPSFAPAKNAFTLLLKIT